MPLEVQKAFCVIQWVDLDVSSVSRFQWALSLDAMQLLEKLPKSEAMNSMTLVTFMELSFIPHLLSCAL